MQVRQSDRDLGTTVILLVLWLLVWSAAWVVSDVWPDITDPATAGASRTAG